MIKLEQHLSHKEFILWDWNGTLINDGAVCWEVTTEMMEKRGLKRVEHEDHRKLFHMPVRSFYEALGVNLSEHSFEELAAEFVVLYRQKFQKCMLYEGAKELLERMKELGKRQSILSAANEHGLQHACKALGIDHFFDHICGLADHHAVSKIERGRELLNTWDVAPEKVILVGDMDHDAHVGQALGIDVILLGDGHQHPDRHTGLPFQAFPTRYF